MTLINTEKKQSQAVRVNRKMPDWLPKKLQSAYNETDLEYTNFCLKIFGDLEAAKRDKFPKETLRIWFIEFVKRGWTKAIVEKRYEALLGKPIFGKENLEFADWVNAVPVMAMDEVSLIVKRRIDAIISRGKYLKDKKVELSEEDKKSVEAAVAMDIAFNYTTTKLELMEKYREIKKTEKLKELGKDD